LLISSQKPKIAVMDVTESQIERPKHGQKRFYSGKQKRHTLKSQLIIDREHPKKFVVLSTVLVANMTTNYL